MRLILAFLALAQARLALFDLELSRKLEKQAAKALQRSEDRMLSAFALADRAGIRRR